MFILDVNGQNEVIGRILDSDTKQPVKDVKVIVKGKGTVAFSNILGYFQASADTNDYLILEKKFYEPGLVKVLHSKGMKLLLKKRSEADYEGGLEVFNAYLMTNIKYPKKALENNTTGRVYISFAIDSTGQMIDIKKIKDIGDDCGNEMIATVKRIPNHWIPAENTTTFIIPAIFQDANSRINFKEIKLPSGKVLEEVVLTKYN